MAKPATPARPWSGLNRRTFFHGLGAAGLGFAAAARAPGARAADDESGEHRGLVPGGSLPVEEMERVLQTKADHLPGVVSFDQDRDDLSPVRYAPLGFAFDKGFELGNDIVFQALRNGTAIANCDVSLRQEHTQKVIDAILGNGLVLQAFHQHWVGQDPQIWHMHFRGIDEPLKLARAVREVVLAAGTKLPQSSPPKHTPLDHARLASILHGHASVGANGAVNVQVPRKNQMHLAGVPVSSFLNNATNVQFQPMPDARHCAVAPDFAMTAGEVQKVMEVMRRHGFHIDCLYNQQTEEMPQLFFSHQVKVGDAYALAEQVRRGLDQTESA